jgi:hypothetical protein
VNEIEVGKVLAMVSALDSRIVTEPMIKMWTAVLNEETGKPWTYEEACAAVPTYFASEAEYLSPRGLIVKMKQARERLAELDQSRMLEEQGWAVSPEPVCRRHDTRITHCLECCSVLHFEAGHLFGDRLHSWALAHLYKPEEAWA